MRKKNNRLSVITLCLLAGALPTLLLLAPQFHGSPTLLTVLVVIGVLLLAAVALWTHANSGANGAEWWQDDHASGWRGY